MQSYVSLFLALKPVFNFIRGLFELFVDFYLQCHMPFKIKNIYHCLKFSLTEYLQIYYKIFKKIFVYTHTHNDKCQNFINNQPPVFSNAITQTEIKRRLLL